MFYHIIMKNFKSNLKNYILFFVSNILAIAELFAFWGLNDVVKKAVKDGVTAATLVTHDPIIASSCDRIIFLKDGKVKEDLKRTGDKEQFYNEIITNWC